MSNINMIEEDDSLPVILIVDDNSQNLQLASGILLEAGYEVAIAMDGRTALGIIDELNPDIILLDVMMPLMNGFDVCRVLKQKPGTCDIPIIFLTALKDIDSVSMGFEAGAVDYINKPFKQKELLLRVKNHLEILRSRRVIQKQNDMLINLNARLEQLNKEKSDLLEITAHDLKNPIQAIFSILDTIDMNIEKMDMANLRRMISSCRKAVGTAAHILADLLDIHGIEGGIVKLSIRPARIYDLASKAFEEFVKAAADKNIKMSIELRGESPFVNLDTNKFIRVVNNLLSNAIKFSPGGSSVRLLAGCDGNTARVSVIDEGPGISLEEQKLLFVKYARLSPRPTGSESSTRLGLSIVKAFTEAMGGKAGCESEPGKGSEFFVEFPVTTL